MNQPVEAILAEAARLAAAQRHAEASARYQAILRADPGNRQAALGLGNLYIATGAFAKAADLIGRTLQAAGAWADGYYCLGIAQSNLGRIAEAMASFQQAVAAEPAHADAHMALGILSSSADLPAEAVESFHKVAALRPSSAEARINLGVVLQELGRPEEAAQSFRQAIVLSPDTAEAHNNLGVALDELAQYDEAMASFRRAIELRPDYAEAHDNLGKTLSKDNRLAEAAASFRQAIAAEPDFAAAHNGLGLVLARLGEPEQAEQHFRSAIALEPDYASAHFNLGNTLRQRERHAEAIDSLERAVALDADDIDAQLSLGKALRGAKRHAEAVEVLARAVERWPDSIDAREVLGVSLLAAARADEALRQFQHMLSREPQHATAHNNIGVILQMQGRHEEAIAAFERALAAKPDYIEARGNMGIPLINLGRQDEARAALEAAIEALPRTVHYYLSIADLRRFKDGEPMLQAMEALAADSAALPENEQIQLHFALGKAYDDVGRHEQAFEHLRRGAALKRRQVAYDEETTLRGFERIREIFGKELLVSRAGSGNPSSLPIFVVGMPRSGTTLVEQVLASHPRVYGAGELEDLGQIAAGAAGAGSGRLADLGIVAGMPDAALRQFGDEYVRRVQTMAPAAERIVDKLPENFRHVGFIRLILPNARIIHMRRNPVDTCLSCFSKLFSGNQPHTYDLAELGRYYRAYDRLAAHWRAVLPPEAMLEVQYEDVVADLEAQARRIVAYCGLEWDEGCLAFHKSNRPVRTASASQVRQPIYSKSVERWLPYKDQLKPLLDELGYA
ncbi:MAG TPA: tetratricopeptide repeat protein [Candidatus Sulfotelmatobacter sp.]|nr:tetratricopeptide repeat protein [Candidatus Sulfotelmatobacter sp.]